MVEPRKKDSLESDDDNSRFLLQMLVESMSILMSFGFQENMYSPF